MRTIRQIWLAVVTVMLIVSLAYVVLGKMISPQNIATGVAVTDLKGKEGMVLARTFVHSVVLTLVLVVIVIIQQFVLPGIIPTLVGSR